MSYFDKTISEKLAQADEYYAEDNNIKSFDWSRYTENERKAGLNQAQREIDLYLGTCLEVLYTDQDFPLHEGSSLRPDYAIFEHALFILDNTARTRTAGTGAQDIESAEYQEEERTSGVTVSPQATRFLRLNTIQIERG